MKKLELYHIKTILKVYFLSISFFSAFRLILFFTSLNKLGNNYELSEIFQAFFMGLRFDTVIACYLLFFPTLLLTIGAIYTQWNKIISKISFFLIFTLFLLAFFVCAADIPYFHQFYSRFSVSAFDWVDSPLFILKMIFEEPTYWLYLIPLIFFIVIYYKLLKRIFNKSILYLKSPKILLNIACSIIFLFLLVLGMRGRIAIKSPIRVGTAFFCNNPFLNKLGLNPNFTLMRSYLDKEKAENQSIHLMDDKMAINNVQNYLGIKVNDEKNPLLRTIKADSSGGQKANIVLIIMESMSEGKMERGGNTHRLTPFLDSLSHQGYYFKNTYSAGIHTFNGIFSSLFSFPALFRQHSMKHTPILPYNGISYALKQLGYSATFFIPHDGQFDNVEGFLMANDFDRVYSKKDYPSDEIKTTLGVPDDYMFRFSIPILNQLSENGKPFFVTFMTASDHGPWYIPPYFHAHSKDKKSQATEYADYSLREFIRIAKQQKWFKNTLFVFVADHGAAIDAKYDISLFYNHVPLLFYSPKYIPVPKDFNRMAGQIDVYPSILGLLGLPFKNNTLGIDLFHKKRPYIYFGVDDKFGIINQKWLYIYRKNNRSGLYKYRQKTNKNYLLDFPKKGQKMKSYAVSNLQTYQYMINHNLTKIR